MSLDVSKWIDELGHAPKQNSKQDILEMLDLIRKKNKVSECFLAIGFSVSEILNERNISDDLFDAYEKSMTNVSQNFTLNERYMHNLEKGEESAERFIDNLTGKLAEVRILNDNFDEIKQKFPEASRIEMPDDPTNPGVDFYVYDKNDQLIVNIQSKSGTEEYSSKVIDDMIDHPDNYYALSNELKESILTKHPELESQIIPGIDFNHIDTRNEVTDSLETLQGNFGLDVPDTFTKAISASPEIIFGYKVLKEVFNSNNEHAQLEKDLKTKLTVLRVAVLLNKFGFIKLGASIGAVSGSGLGLLGAIAGGVGGAFIGNKTASLIEPQLLDLVLKIMELSKDDLFYYKNKNSIDDFALSFSESNKLFN